MSGGHFNYKQDSLLDMVDDVRFAILINYNKEKNECGNDIGNRFSPETIEEFEKAVKALKMAYVYAQRIDWLLSGDDGEDSFHKRLQAQLGELK
jgi:methyl coenzyme M reductase alpha subunit